MTSQVRTNTAYVSRAFSTKGVSHHLFAFGGDSGGWRDRTLPVGKRDGSWVPKEAGGRGSRGALSGSGASRGIDLGRL